MKKLIRYIFNLAILGSLSLFTSCTDEPDHVDTNCGIIETKISELSYSIGSYTSNLFTNVVSTNFKESGIRIEIDEILRKLNCFEFTPDPQIIEAINIASSKDLFSGGVAYSEGDNLNELFKIHNESKEYSVSEFILAQTRDPLLFSEESDQLILQLVDKPDVYIQQSFELSISFDDSETLIIEILNFEASD